MTVPTFRFAINQPVEMMFVGTIVKRTESLEGPNEYVVRYPIGDGKIVHKRFTEDEVRPSIATSPRAQVAA